MADNIEITMLGTGNAMVTKCYNTCFTIRTGEGYFLVDAGGGNGILSQLEKAGIGIEKIRGMFVTHGHTDHVLGAIWIIRIIAMLACQGQLETPFTIYCHDEVAGMLETFCRMTLKKKHLETFGNKIIIRTVENGENATCCGIKFTFFDICSTKKKQFGFKAELPDGHTLACLGDEPYNEKCRQFAEGCDWLMHEAFCLHSDKETFKPYEKHHSTALDAAKNAQALGIRNLIIYHTEDTDLPHRKENYTSEASKAFKGKIFVPNDLETITL